jgi:hypothetical protein
MKEGDTAELYIICQEEKAEKRTHPGILDSHT